MACRALFDIVGAFPDLGPDVVWHQRSRGQMMMLWREAQRVKNHRMAHDAIVAHAAVGAAIVNMWGKDSPAFHEMINDLLSEDGTPVEAKIDDVPTLEALSIKRESPSTEWADMKEF